MKGTLCQILLVLVAISNLSLSNGSIAEETSTGADFFEIESPIFYTTFVPIIYEIEVPKWKEDDLKIKWKSGHSTSCNSSESSGSTTSAGCASVYHYNSVISNFFSKTTTFLDDFKEYNQLTKVNTPSCEEIQPHFQSTKFTANNDSANYLEFLKQCPVKEAEIVKVNSFSKLDLTKFDYMLKRFYDVIIANIGITWPGVGLYTNAYSAYQAGALVMHHAEMVRWDQAISQCNSKQFPRGLVDNSKLTSSLTTLKSKLAGKNFELSIPDLRENLYHTLPLTDCFYSSQNGSYVIELLVPLRPKNSKFNLVQLNAIPFGNKFNSSLETNLICSLTNIEGKYIHEKTNNFASKTDCKSSKLCFVHNLKSWVTIDPCITAIFENNTENMQKYCETKCYPTTTDRFPLFKRLSSDKFVVVGHTNSKLEIFISCHGNPVKVISPNATGALEIQISCDCKIVYKSQEFQAYKSCGNDLVLKHLNQLITETSNEPRSLYAEKQQIEILDLKESDLFAMKLCIISLFCIVIGLSVAVTVQCFFFRKQLQFMKYSIGRMNPTDNDKVTFRKGEGFTADANLSPEHEYAYVN